MKNDVIFKCWLTQIEDCTKRKVEADDICGPWTCSVKLWLAEAVANFSPASSELLLILGNYYRRDRVSAYQHFPTMYRGHVVRSSASANHNFPLCTGVMVYRLRFQLNITFRYEQMSLCTVFGFD